MDSIAITDHGVMFGVIEFYKACIAGGIKPSSAARFMWRHAKSPTRRTRTGSQPTWFCWRKTRKATTTCVSSCPPVCGGLLL